MVGMVVLRCVKGEDSLADVVVLAGERNGVAVGDHDEEEGYGDLGGCVQCLFFIVHV
jgi:hypothetical protein